MQRPPATPEPKAGAVAQAGKIELDMVATDAEGRPVGGLQPWDFAILDNGQPRKVKTFREFGGATMPMPPVEVFLVIDTLNLPFQQVAFVRDQLSSFLRSNGGRLQQPVTLVELTDKGVQIQPRSSTDGNALAEVVRQLNGHIGTITSAMGADGLVERFQVSMHQLMGLAENLALKPGRKLLVWIGPGWPLLTAPDQGDPTRGQRLNFDAIVELSTQLRRGRMVLYSVQPTQENAIDRINATMYQGYLKGVRTPHEAQSANLGLKVLVTQTGGLILGPDNNLAEQIRRCVEDANAFYRISFDPPQAEHADEYHELRITVNRPGVVVRTNMGYYNQPNQH